MKQHDTVKPFEFLLKINNNIICQRYFNIKNYNPDCRESLEIKEMMDEIMGVSEQVKLGILPEFFKQKCLANTWDSYNPNYYQPKNRMYIKNIFDKQDILQFDVLVYKEVACSGFFDGSVFQSGVRRNINIKEIIPQLIKTIGYFMSLDEYAVEYGGVKLVRHNDYAREGVRK
jgi:hypothetical protein